ncbi:MAG TPA: hypothetical protein VGU02_02275 [Gaiellaceae bacterium]|nr:hypothetical protein [Gaiellaceae bacterium]
MSNATELRTPTRRHAVGDLNARIQAPDGMQLTPFLAKGGV